jgi:lysophospholipase L1-like esterase
MSGKPKPSRRLLVLVPLAATVIALIAAEVFVRALRIAPPAPPAVESNVADPFLPFMRKPGSDTWVTSSTGEFTREYRHNSAGLRDVEHDTVSTAYRILGLGDSFTYGVGATFDSTWLSRLERSLNTGGRAHVEIVKAGVPRFFPEAERIFLEHYGVKYAPRLILVGFVPNDIVDSRYGLRDVTVDPAGFLVTRQGAKLGAAGRILYRNSALARVALPRLVMLTRQKPPSPYAEDGSNEREWRTVEREYARIVAIADSIQAKVVIVHIPQRGPWSSAKFVPAQRLRAWAAAHGAGFVDVLPAMLAASRTRGALYYERDGHPTERGHEVIARAVHDWLTARDRATKSPVITLPRRATDH